jgi:hypothetical protein
MMFRYLSGADSERLISENIKKALRIKTPLYEQGYFTRCKGIAPAK